MTSMSEWWDFKKFYQKQIKRRLSLIVKCWDTYDLNTKVYVSQSIYKDIYWRL